MKYLIYTLALLCLMAGLPACKDKNKEDQAQAGAVPAEEQVTQGNRYPIDSAEVVKYLLQWGDTTGTGKSVLDFYASNNYYPAWSEKGKLTKVAHKFMERLAKAYEDGLDPERFHIQAIRSLHKKAEDEFSSSGDVENRHLEQLDVLLTHEFYEFAQQMMEGVAHEHKTELNWYVADSGIHYDTVLRHVLLSEEKEDPLEYLEPPHEDYKLLKKALASYRSYAKKGGWPQLSGFEKLKLGDTSRHVIKVRERLSITGDFRPASENFYNPRIFDRNLDLAVRAFQTRNGLEPDGVVGGETLRALNIPVEDRIKTILVNMERWRLVPRDMGTDYLMVNVPEFRLYIVEDKKVAFSMRAVVGKEFNPTPIFNDRLQNVVFSPYWNVPKSITAEEILPLMYKNPGYLRANNMEVIKGWGEGMEVVPAWTVPWGQINEPGFQYWIRQGPGPDNPLGLVKFLFPNNHNVYLHDTPSDYLFKRVRRDFSHGCIRLEEPGKLARYLLRNNSSWTPERIEEAMRSGDEQYVTVKPQPVYILYFTAFGGEDGKLHFRKDIYNLDQSLNKFIYV